MFAGGPKIIVTPLHPHTLFTESSADTGPDVREGKLGSCPGPPQLGGLHINSKKIYLRKHKNTF